MAAPIYASWGFDTVPTMRKIFERVVIMSKLGIITKFTICVDNNLLGYDHLAFVGVNIKPGLADQTTEVMLEETKLYNHREHIRRSSKEMILIYLITIFEEFLDNLLSSLFRKRPEILKSSQRSITYQEAFQYADLYELLKLGSKGEARLVTDLDVDKLGKYLSTKFKLNLNQRRDWDQFKEFFYRRHIIVHNYGYPDSIYIAKIKRKVHDDEWLEIENTYLAKAFDIFQNYSNYISGFFDKKYS